MSLLDQENNYTLDDIDKEIARRRKSINDEIGKRETAAGIVPEKESGILSRIGASWETGKRQTAIGQLGYRQLLGDESPETERQVSELEAIPEGLPAKWGYPEKAVREAARLLPTMTTGMKKGAERGLMLGGGAAAITAIAGQAGPQALLPEEAITVPIAAAGGYAVGMTSGILENIGQIEAGHAYRELLHLKDDQGNTISPTIAKGAAAGVGVVNGLIELAQIKLLLKTIPGGEKMLRGIVNETIKKAVTSNTLKGVALKYAGKYGKFVAGETAQEVAQESTNILAIEIAKKLDKKLAGSNISAATRKEITDRLIDTAKSSAMAFSVMGLPGSVVSGGIEARKLPHEKVGGTLLPTEATNLINAIDKSMATGEIGATGRPFTPDLAIAVIKQGYDDNVLTDKDLEELGEKYPELKNEIISEKVKSEINQEIQSAEKPISARGVLGAEDVTAKELLTGKREKALTSEELIAERARVFEETPRKLAEVSAEIFEKEITEEERVRAAAGIEPDINKFLKRGYEPKHIPSAVEITGKGKGIPTTPDQKRLLKGMTVEQAQEAAKSWNDIWDVTKNIAEKEARIVEAQTLIRERPDLFNVELFAPEVQEYLELPSGQGFTIKPETKLRKPPIPKSYEADISYKPILSKSGKPFKSMAWANRVLKSKGLDPTQYTIIEYGKGFAIQRFGRKVKSEMPAPTEPKTDVVPEPVVEKPIVPDFKSTQEAYAFGEKATPEQAKELLRLRKVHDAKFETLKKTGSPQEIMDEAVKGQFYNEALQKIEGTEQYEKFKEKEVTPEKEPWEMTVKELAEQEGDWYKGKQYLIPRDKFKRIGLERAFIKKGGDYYNIMADGSIGNKLEKVLYDRKIKQSVESHRYYVEKAIKEGKPIPPEVLKDYPDLKAKVEVKTTPEGKEVSVDLTKKEEAVVTPKQQKEYLMAEIDKAIESSLKEAGIESMERAKELRKMRIDPFQQLDTVFKFEVPNDGTFEIPVGILFEFQDRVKSAFPATIISKQFKPTKSAKKAIPTAKYNKIIGVASEKLKPVDIDRIFEEVADTEIRDTTDTIHLNAFQNWLLSQNISKSVIDKIRLVARKDYIEEARVKIETQDIGYAESMIEHTRGEFEYLQSLYDEYKAGEKTLKQINEETETKRSGRELAQESDDAKSAYYDAVKHLEELQKTKGGVSEAIYKVSEDALAEQYVPITRKEADNLFDKGAADLVARFNIRGAETTGEEGYYMRTPVQKEMTGYGDKQLKYTKEVLSSYEKYKERHGGAESGISITRGDTDQQRGRLPSEVRKAEEGEKKFAAKEDIESGTRKILNANGKSIGNITLSRKNDVVNIDDIEILSEKGKGIGTKTIRDLMGRADKEGLMLTLSSDAMRGKESQRLNRLWYANLGFTRNIGKNRIKGTSEEFYYNPEGKTKFATKATKPQDTITRKDLREIFNKMKNVMTGQDKDGNFYFKTVGQPKVTIFEVDSINGYINTSSGQIPVGSFLKGKIELKTKGAGATADIGTIWHEFFHGLKRDGIISDNDNKALNRAIAKLKGIDEKSITEEDQAYYVGDTLHNWQSQKNLRIKRILKKIADFMNAVYEFVARTKVGQKLGMEERTARGVLRDIESGKILSEKELSGVNQFAQDVSFSLKKAAKAVTDNPNFVKWFKGSRVLDKENNPLPVFHGTAEPIHIFKPSERGRTTASESAKKGFFFASNKEVAQGYAEFARPKKIDLLKSKYERLEKIVQRVGTSQTWNNYDKAYAKYENAELTYVRDSRTSEENIVEAYLSIKNPLIHDYDGTDFRDESYSDLIDNAIESGNDGVIFKNTYDGTGELGTRTNPLMDVYVAFESTQIKSIFNTGAYGLTEPDIRYAMAGKKAIGAPTGQLVKAQEMLAEGKSEKEVWKETGWLKGAEKKETWKFEIDDSGAKITPKKYSMVKEKVSLSDILEHNALYKAYPEIKKVAVFFDPKTTGGTYSKVNDVITIGTQNIIDADGIKKVLFHEIAHKIQEIEGFVRGGSPAAVRSIDIEKAALELNDAWRKIPREVRKEARKKYKGSYGKMAPSLMNLYGERITRERIDDSMDVVDKIPTLYRESIENAIDELEAAFISKYGYGEKKEQDEYRQYLKIAGEIEARDTSARAKLTPEQRREQIPYEAEGIPREDWIITDGEGTSFSIEETKQFATKPTLDYKELIREYQKAHTTPLVDDLIEKTQADFDPVNAKPEETRAFFKDVRKNLLPKRFRSEVLSIRDMEWYHKALETPYVLAKKFPSMKAAVKSEIKRHETRTKKMFDYYHGDLADFQKHMQENPSDLKAFEALIWKWENHRFFEKDVPTDWFSVVEDELVINPEHYAEVKKFLKKQGVKDVIADGFITVRKTLDNILIEADSIMQGNNIDQSDLQEFRSYIGKTHNYFSHTREGNSYIKITDRNTKKTVYREHFWEMKERILPHNKRAKARTEKWLNEQLASGELTGKKNDYIISPAKRVTKLPDEIFFQIPVEALSQISIEAGKGLSASRVHYEAKRLMKKEGLSEKEAHNKAYNILTADMGRILAKAMADVLKTRGWGQHAIQRQNIPGFKKTDVFETLSGYLTGYAGFATKIQAAKEHSKTLRDMDARKTPNAYKYTSKYVRDMLSNADKTDQMVDRLRGLFFIKYLGGVVKSGIVNLTQNAVMAGPILSQYTKFSHTKLAKAMVDVKKGIIGKNAWMGKETDYKNLSKDEQKALTEMVETGAAQDLYLRELKGDIPGRGWGKYVRKVMDKSGIFMQIAEKFNRASTGLAAYRVAFKEGVLFEDKQTKGNHDLSVQFAKGVIYYYHFLYGKPNLPAGYRGGDFRKIARAAYTLRSFTHNYLDIMVDLMANQGTQGFKVAGRSLMNLMMVGGLTSIPFFKALSEVIKWASDDEDEDVLTEIRGTMSNKFMQDVLVYGLVGATGGFDLSGSLSIEVPRSFKDIVGVPYAIYEDSMNMVKSVKAGNLYRAVSETPFTPIVMRNAMRGIELYTKGQRTRGGKAINVPGKREPRKITGAEAIKKSILGLQPTEVSSGYKAYRASAKMKAAMQDKKRNWADRIANAKIARDFRKVRKIEREIQEWNRQAQREGKRWREVDIDEMVENRLTGKGLKGFPVKMREEAKKRYGVWQ